MIGKKVITRNDGAGVFFGELVSAKKDKVILKNVKKLYYWSGAAAIEQLAVEGVKSPEKCKFTVVVEEMEIGQTLQIIPCTKEAIKNIEAVPTWRID